MSMTETEVSLLETISPKDTQFTDPVYKKWFKLKDRGGFLSITPADKIGKWVIDIGTVDGSNSVVSHTMCYLDMYEFNAYLSAVCASGVGDSLYPERTSCPSPESFVAFGGGKADGDQVISRVFKSHWWNASAATSNNAKSVGERSSFVFKCGHFEARTSDTGAIIPNLSKNIRKDMIKVTRTELYEIYYRLDTYLKKIA